MRQMAGLRASTVSPPAAPGPPSNNAQLRHAQAMRAAGTQRASWLGSAPARPSTSAAPRRCRCVAWRHTCGCSLGCTASRRCGGPRGSRTGEACTPLPHCMAAAASALHEGCQGPRGSRTGEARTPLPRCMAAAAGALHEGCQGPRGSRTGEARTPLPRCMAAAAGALHEGCQGPRGSRTGEMCTPLPHGCCRCVASRLRGARWGWGCGWGGGRHLFLLFVSGPRYERLALQCLGSFNRWVLPQTVAHTTPNGHAGSSPRRMAGGKRVWGGSMRRGTQELGQRVKGGLEGGMERGGASIARPPLHQ